MAEIATLSLEVKSDSVKQASIALRDMVPAASAAERAAQRWGTTTTAAARTADDFSKRVQGTIKNLEFERQQVMRSAAEQERYIALRRAGVTAMSAEGQAISAAVAALQKQRAAAQASAAATKESGNQLSFLTRHLGAAAVAYVALEKAREVWSRAMKAGDIGEQAEQIGVTTDQLQAYRFAGAQAGIETEQMDTALTKLAKAMGSANEGNKEMIELFTKLGVKILDVNGNLRPTGDVMPEIAKGILEVGSSSQKTADLMTLFGRSGAKMTTVLEDIAKGNNSVVGTAKQAGAVIDSELIAVWDKYNDALVRAALTADVTYAKIGAPIATNALLAVEKILNNINDVMDKINSKEGFWASILAESRANGQIGTGPNALKLEPPDVRRARLLAEQNRALADPKNAGREALIQEDIDRMNAEALQRQLGGQGGIQGRGAASSSISRILPSVAGPAGVRNPTPTGGGSDPFKSASEGARDYIEAKKAEAAAVGQSIDVAARMKHEQELVNKASSEGKLLTEAQTNALKALAGQMAEADAKLASAKFMDSMKTKTQEFLDSQKLEQDSLFLSQQATDALKFSQELLNQAKADGLVIDDALTAKIRENADAMAAAKAKTDNMREAVEFGRDVVKGFATDITQGLRSGADAWEVFGNAAQNVLNKIADKLTSMAIDKLFESAFGGASAGAGGGFLGAIFGSLFGGGGAGAVTPNAAGMSDVVGTGLGQFGFAGGFAKGGAFNHGNVIPFASGGVVGSATSFGMSGGRKGVMGEAGPEGILPLKRGPGGRLGVEVNGGAQSSPTVVIEQTNHFGSDVSRDEMGRWAEIVKQKSIEGAKAAVIDDRRRGGSMKKAFG